MSIYRLKLFITVNFLIVFLLLPNYLFSIGQGTIKITGYFQVQSNDSAIYFKNVVSGFIVGNSGYIVTTFSGIKGASYVTADTGFFGSTGTIKLFSPENLKLSNYFIDEQRDIIVFYVNDYIPNSFLLFQNDNLIDSVFCITVDDKILGCKIDNLINTFKSSYLIFKTQIGYDVSAGTPLLNKNGECAGMVLYIDAAKNKIYSITSRQIENIIHHLSINKDINQIRPLLDDYIVPAMSLSKSIQCSNKEIEDLIIK